MVHSIRLAHTVNVLGAGYDRGMPESPRISDRIGPFGTVRQALRRRDVLHVDVIMIGLIGASRGTHSPGMNIYNVTKRSEVTVHSRMH